MKPKRLAILTRTLHGRFGKWRKGMHVYARYVRGLSYCIERKKRIPAGILKEGLPLVNEMVGVSKRALRFTQPATYKPNEEKNTHRSS